MSSLTSTYSSEKDKCSQISKLWINHSNVSCKVCDLYAHQKQGIHVNNPVKKGRPVKESQEQTLQEEIKTGEQSLLQSLLSEQSSCDTSVDLSITTTDECLGHQSTCSTNVDLSSTVTVTDECPSQQSTCDISQNYTSTSTGQCLGHCGSLPSETSLDITSNSPETPAMTSTPVKRSHMQQCTQEVQTTPKHQKLSTTIEDI